MAWYTPIYILFAITLICDAAVTTIKSPIPTTKSPTPTTKSPIPTTKSPTPTTKSPTPTTKSPTPTTKSPLPTTKSPTPTTKSPIPTTKSPTPTTKSPTPTTKSPTPTTKSPLPTTKSPTPTTKSPTPTTKSPTPTTQSPTPSTTKSTSTPPVTTTSSLSIFIPDTFDYNCTENGGITIMNVKNPMKYINNDTSHCSGPTNGTGGSIKLTKCKLNTTVTIVLEATHTEGILGGLHSKTFQIKCEAVNIKPYLLNVTAQRNIGDQPTQQVVDMVANNTPTPIQSLVTKIKADNNQVDEAYIGQKLVIAIQIPATASIKPTVCDATGNGKNVTLWQDTGCQHDEELFGERWTNKSGEVRNTMYGFRFVGSSTSITITCTVRVCPDGYKGHLCDLSTCGSRKRKRITRLPEAVTIQKATTTLTIRDPLLTSGAGRKAHELNIIIGIALATVGFLKITFFQG